MVKEKEYDEAARIFQTTNVQITTEGRRLLGAALGTATFTENFVGDRVAALEQELDTLAKVAQTQPQAAHSALVHGLASKWLYLARTIPEISEELQPLENSLHQRLIPAITGRDPSSNMERDLLALPARHGGLGIAKPPQAARRQHLASMSLTSNLIQKLTEKVAIPDGGVPEPKSKSKIHQEARRDAQCAAAELHQQLPEKLQHARALASEKGASSWITTLPLSAHGFELPKGAFRDALCLRPGMMAGRSRTYPPRASAVRRWKLSMP